MSEQKIFFNKVLQNREINKLKDIVCFIATIKTLKLRFTNVMHVEESSQSVNYSDKLEMLKLYEQLMVQKEQQKN